MAETLKGGQAVSGVGLSQDAEAKVEMLMQSAKSGILSDSLQEN